MLLLLLRPWHLLLFLWNANKGYQIVKVQQTFPHRDLNSQPFDLDNSRIRNHVRVVILFWDPDDSCSAILSLRQFFAGQFMSVTHSMRKCFQVILKDLLENT